MPIRSFRYATDSNIADLKVDIYNVSDMLVKSSIMSEINISGIYRADISLSPQMEWGIISSISNNIQLIFKLPYNESSKEISDAFFIRSEFLNLSKNVSGIYDIEFGKWQILNNQMIFFKQDNVTEISRFNLFDSAGQPSENQVFKREKV